MEAAARPLPKLDTTPPVTKTYFADMGATSFFDCWDGPYRVDTIEYDRDGARRKEKKAMGGVRRTAMAKSLSGFKNLGSDTRE